MYLLFMYIEWDVCTLLKININTNYCDLEFSRLLIKFQKTTINISNANIIYKKEHKSH